MNNTKIPIKALVIAPQPFFTARGTPFSVYYRTMLTAGLGVKVDLLTYGEGQDVDIPDVRIIRIPRFAQFGNVKIGPSGLKLFLDFFIVFWTLALLIRNRYDFVHAHEESVFLCRFLKPIFRFKLVYDMHSSLPQQLSNFAFTKSKLIIGVFETLEKSCIRVSDVIITICPALADYVDQLIGRQDKHLLIENSIFDEVKLSQSAPNDGSTNGLTSVSEVADDAIVLPKNRPLVVYTGTLEAYQGIELLISAFAQVLTIASEAILLIVGGSPEQVKHYSDFAKQQGLGPNCIFTGRVPQTLAKYYNSLASVIVSPRISGTNTPLKIYEQLFCGVPLVATNIYSHTQVLNSDVAFLVDPEPDSMAKGLIEAMNAKDLVTTVVANAKKLYDSKYSRRVYESKIGRMLEILKT